MKTGIKRRFVLPVLIAGLGLITADWVTAQSFTNLHSFTAVDPTSSANSDGANPVAGLILSGSTLYGTAIAGGRSGTGTVFALNTDGTDFTNLHTFAAATHAGSPNYGFSFNSDGANPQAGLILSGNTLYAQTGLPLTGALTHDKAVFAAQFSPDGRRVLTASWDKTARVWDAESGLALTEPLKHPNGLWSAQFSPDGKRIVTASEDHTTRVWDLAPLQEKFPEWLLPLAEAISGEALNRQGLLEETKLNRAETPAQIRQKLKAAPGDDDWVVWGRWFLGDPATRTISPFSSITVPQYIENRISEQTAESLDEAARLAKGNIELLERISEARKAMKPANQAANQPAPAN